MNTNSQWPFQDNPATACATTKKVTGRQMPIVYASRAKDEDGELMWDFLCEAGFDMAEGQLVRLDTILRLDPSIADLADLPIGYEAIRNSPADAWQRRPRVDEQSE